MTQTWHDLLFAHWPVEARALAAMIPFPLDLFDGRAWVGVVPFRMTNVAPRSVPALPWLSAFPELNVRTYVTVGAKPGVFFFSLDAGKALAVLAAKGFFNLPYFSASMTVKREGAAVSYSSRRRRGEARFEATYRPVKEPSAPRPGTLEQFLTERYCLYQVDHRGRPYRLDIHHPPWPLQIAEAQFAMNTMAEAAGIILPGTEPLLHFSRRQDMIAWAPRRLNRD